MGNRVNIAGATFGRLTAITPTDKRAKDGGVIWKCKCECGRLCFVKAAYLTKGHTKSCGCLSRDNCSITGKNGRSRRKHGLCGTRLYNIWGDMKQRCYNPAHGSYKNYGARGITICSEWIKNFESFAKWANEKREEYIMEQTKQEYIALISALLAESEDIGLLDLIYRILQKSRQRGA